MRIKEGLSFSDYFDDDVPVDVKPPYQLTPMEENKEDWMNEDSRLTDGWLDKSGNFFNDGDSHWGMGRNYLKSKGIECGSSSVYEEMYDLGCIRIWPSYFKQLIHIEYHNHKPTNSQMKFLKDYCIIHKSRLMDDSNNEEIDLNEQDFPIQSKNLFKGLHEEHIGGDAEYWLDKNGKFHRAFNGHQSFAEEYFLRQNISYNTRVDAYSDVGCYNVMYNLGFVRVWSDRYYDTIYANSTKELTNLQLRNLKDSAIESEKKLTINRKDVNLNESLISEDVLNNNREYWMDSKGRFLRAPNGHEDWAFGYLDGHNIQYDLDRPYEPYSRMFELGFIRIKVNRDEIYFQYNKQKPPSNLQSRNLRDSALESGMTLYADEYNGETNTRAGRKIEIDESDDNKKLERMNSYWLDKDGKFHRVGLHVHWGMDYLRKNNIQFGDNIYKQMFELGFVRIRVESTLIHFEYEAGRYPKNSQIRILKNAAIENEMALYDDIIDKSISLNELKYVNKGNKQLFIESMNPDNIDTFKTHLTQLFAYLQKELQLKTIPKVKLVSDDKNADKVLGKTAYYNPDGKEIVLYTTNRHQKDILRSFAHEVIHHWQHENEKLQTSSKGGKRGEGVSDPQYAQKNPWLRQMEKQAYLLGNIMFRDWEDAKKAKDKKNNIKMT